MLCEGENTVDIDVFELAVAQNTAIYSVFEPAVKKKLQFETTWSPKTLLFARFFTFSCKDVKPRQFTKTLQKPLFHFCPAKTAKTVAQTAPKSQNLVPRPPDKRHEKKKTS